MFHFHPGERVRVVIIINMAYDRNDLVSLIEFRLNQSAGKPVLSQAQIRQVLNSFAELLPGILAEYGHCRIHQLGVFRLREKKPRRFFNIAAGAVGQTAVHFKIEFNSAEALKRRSSEIINFAVK